MKIHHIGYLVKNIEKAREQFMKMGFCDNKSTVFDAIRNVHICFIKKDGYCIELIQPTKDSAIYGLLKKYKNTAYHICYQVDDMRRAIEELEQMGFYLFEDVKVAPAISDNAKVAFLMGKDCGIIEILDCGSL